MMINTGGDSVVVRCLLQRREIHPAVGRSCLNGNSEQRYEIEENEFRILANRANNVLQGKFW